MILWPDTFNNHFYPDTAKAAVEVLEAAGFRVTVPQVSLCCGRPLYDFGFLGLAQSLLTNILATLRPDIAAGVPVVGLEPSCVAVFRNELLNLYPHDEDAKRLAKQTFTLGEFFAKKAPDYRPPPLHRKAIVHGHCHHKAVMGLTGEETLMKKAELDVDVLDSGCCGVSGSFGFKAEHYDLSMQIGELVLLPAVRAAPKDALIVSDGFSCREQIRHGTDRRGLHLAQVLQMGLREGPAGPSGAYPERACDDTVTRQAASHSTERLLAGAGLMALGAALLFAWRRWATGVKP